MAYRRISLLLISALMAGGAAAAELGEPRVSSYRGQSLVADIELSGLDDPAAAVQVRVASPDVYRGASMSVPPVLSALTLSVVKKDGKQFVHVTSNRPVDTEMLLLYLELGQGGQKDVRLATLFLTADPRPAPPPPPPPVAVVVAPPAAASAPVPVVAPVALPLHLAPVSTALPVSLRPAPPGTCKPSSSNSACAILDKKNVALQAKLAGLEDKIKQLQATMVVAEEVHAAPIVPPIAALKPPPAPVAVLVTPKKPKPVVPPPSATPWLWIGVAAAVALASLGAIVFLLLRRRRGLAAPVVPAGPKPPGFMDGVRNRLMPGKTAKAEPVLEEA